MTPAPESHACWRCVGAVTDRVQRGVRASPPYRRRKRKTDTQRHERNAHLAHTRNNAMRQRQRRGLQKPNLKFPSVSYCTRSPRHPTLSRDSRAAHVQRPPCRAGHAGARRCRGAGGPMLGTPGEQHGVGTQPGEREQAPGASCDDATPSQSPAWACRRCASNAPESRSPPVSRCSRPCRRRCTTQAAGRAPSS